METFLPFAFTNTAGAVALGILLGLTSPVLLARLRGTHVGAARKSLEALLTKHAPAIAWQVDAKLRIVACIGGEALSLSTFFRSQHGAPIGDIVETNRRVQFDIEHGRAVTGEPRHFELELEDRLYRVILDPVTRGAKKRVVAVNGVAVDITETRSLEEKLMRERHIDELTGLATRTLLYDRLAQAIHISARSSRGVAVLAMDLDRFKHINETSGHSAGDELLMAVAERLRSLLRKADTVARLSADDFAAVLMDVDSAENAATAASKVVTAFEQPFLIHGVQHYATLSIGIALSPFDGDNAQTLLQNAETARSFAKVAGGNAFHFYTESMHRHIADRVALESALRVALEREEIGVHYQPLVGQDGSFEGVEALARWYHPIFGHLSPDRFIPLAEETGLIMSIGEYVMRRACREFATLQGQVDHRLRLAINLSPKQFDDAHLVDVIASIVAETDMDPHSLELELTEGMLMHDLDSAIRTLLVLKALGLSIAIDDFGTGYSSLAYLKRLPIDTLKIDRTFVSELPDDIDAGAIVTAVCSLAHALSLRVVAEGVETPEQLKVLLEMGCDTIQGYLFGRPMKFEDILPLVKSNNFASIANPPSRGVTAERVPRVRPPRRTTHR